jgi:hypothetical protein
MRLAISRKNTSLGLATAAILLAGLARAQTSQSAMGASATGASWQLAGVNARLDKALDSQTAKAGQPVEATLNGAVRTPDGKKLPKGTELWGTVDNVQPSQDGGPSSLSLAFTTAQLEDGQKMPVKVTVVGAFPGSQASEASYDGVETMGPPPEDVNGSDKYDQEPGLLSHVAMMSSVHSQNSATFSRKDGDLMLKAGIFLQIGIAPANAGGGTNGGS